MGNKILDTYRIYSIKRRGVYFFQPAEGGSVYSRAVLIRGWRLNIGQNKQYV